MSLTTTLLQSVFVFCGEFRKHQHLNWRGFSKADEGLFLSGSENAAEKWEPLLCLPTKAKCVPFALAVPSPPGSLPSSLARGGRVNRLICFWLPMGSSPRDSPAQDWKEKGEGERAFIPYRPPSLKVTAQRGCHTALVFFHTHTRFL